MKFVICLLMVTLILLTSASGNDRNASQYVPHLVEIGKIGNAFLGQENSVSIDMVAGEQEQAGIGGFDLLLSYDARMLSLTSVVPGAFISDCEWEYFVYRYGRQSRCGDELCPTGTFRIVSIADINNGTHHPVCFAATPGERHELAKLQFLITNDATFECEFATIRWVWYDCGDNSIANVDGRQLYISRRVFDHDSDPEDSTSSIADTTAEYPTMFGANYVCDTITGKHEIVRWIDFVNGGVALMCADSIDERGDLNQNGLPYEVADVVLFSHYFTLGPSVFGMYYQAAVAASDVNADGATLTVADLVYLIHVVNGTALPNIEQDTVTCTIHGQELMVDREVGAAVLTLSGNQSPVLLANQMDMQYVYHPTGKTTRVLVSSTEGYTFRGPFLSVEGDILEIELASPQGGMVDLSLEVIPLPGTFELAQNYPNPFNASTTIGFSLPHDGDYELIIYNAVGQKVADLSGSAPAGYHRVSWDAEDQSTGVYFYEISTGEFSARKKMVLLK